MYNCENAHLSYFEIKLLAQKKTVNSHCCLTNEPEKYVTNGKNYISKISDVYKFPIFTGSKETKHFKRR